MTLFTTLRVAPRAAWSLCSLVNFTARAPTTCTQALAAEAQRALLSTTQARRPASSEAHAKNDEPQEVTETEKKLTPAERAGFSKRSEKISWLLIAMGAYSKKNLRALTASRMLQTCLNNFDRKEWYADGMISSEFLPRQLWLSTNVWIISRRLLKEGEEGKRIQEFLFDELWRETSRQMRSIKVADGMLQKYLKETQQHTFASLVQFDHAYTIKARDERMDALAGALWRTVFQSTMNVKENTVKALASYVDSELKAMLKMHEHDLLKVTFDFEPPPRAILELSGYSGRGRLADAKSTGAPEKGKNAKQGHVSDESSKAVDLGREDSEREEKEPLSLYDDRGADGQGRWRSSLAEGGKVYFWHTASKKAQFDKPEGYEEYVPTTMPKQQPSSTTAKPKTK